MFNQEPADKAFEISLIVRDSEGNPTDKRRSYSSDNPYKIWQFFNRFQGKPKRKKKRKTKATTKENAEKILTEMFNENSESE